MTESAKHHGDGNMRRMALRIVYATIAIVVWIATLGGRLRRRRRVVLCYHGVTSDQRTRFERQMKRLSGRTVTMNALDTPPTGRGRPEVIVTFDDAFANLIANALPALERHSVPAMIFAVSNNLGDRPRWSMPEGYPDRFQMVMSEEELKAVQGHAGVTIGSHTMTHPRLDSIPRDQLERELVESRERLAALLGHEMVDLALPHGAYNSGVIRAAKLAGYQRILTLEHVLEPSGLEDGVIGRFSASPEMSMLEFRLTIDGAYGWLGAFRRLVNGRRGGKASSARTNTPAEAAA